MKPAVLFVALLPIALLAAAKFPRDTLNDDALVKFAKPFHGSRDWVAFPKSGTILGTHHDTKVVVEVRCSDVCPDYTRMVIHYDVKPGPACSDAGGSEVDVLMPFAIAIRSEKFCVPRVLVQDRLYSAP
jgi:hypothetical protein